MGQTHHMGQVRGAGCADCAVTCRAPRGRPGPYKACYGLTGPFRTGLGGCILCMTVLQVVVVGPA